VALSTHFSPRPRLLLGPFFGATGKAGLVLCGSVGIASGLQLSGCGVQCEGVGCAEEYGASRVNIHFADTLLETGSHNPRRSDASVIGAASAGVDWSVRVVGNRLWVGMPEPGEVRSYTLDVDFRLEHTAHDALFQSDLGGDGLGASLLDIGDIGGDGIHDVIVTAPTRTVGELGRESGAVYLVPASELTDGTTPLDNSLARRITGPQPGAHFGEVVSTCPDIDGDGQAELLVGMPWYDDKASGSRTVHLAGAAALVLSTNFPEPGESWSAEAAELWTGADPGARAGTAVACADVIGNNTPDILIGAPYADGDHEGEGAIYIINGANRRTGELSLVADRVLVGTLDNGWLGWSIATGDLDGDGQPDVVAGAPGHLLSLSAEVNRPQGLVSVWDGASLKSSRQNAPEFRITGSADGDSVGRALLIEDTNQDGVADLLIGAPRREVSGAYDAGALYIFPGYPDHAGLRPERTVRDAPTWWEASRAYLQTGGTFTLGDLDGDTAPDLILVHRRQPG
jgi:hypothetical protein